MSLNLISNPPSSSSSVSPAPSIHLLEDLTKAIKKHVGRTAAFNALAAKDRERILGKLKISKFNWATIEGKGLKSRLQKEVETLTRELRSLQSVAAKTLPKSSVTKVPISSQPSLNSSIPLISRIRLLENLTKAIRKRTGRTAAFNALAVKDRARILGKLKISKFDWAIIERKGLKSRLQKEVEKLTKELRSSQSNAEKAPPTRSLIKKPKKVQRIAEPFPKPLIIKHAFHNPLEFLRQRPSSESIVEAMKNRDKFREELETAGVPASYIQSINKDPEYGVRVNFTWKELRALSIAQPGLGKYFPEGGLLSMEDPLFESSGVEELLPAFLTKAEDEIGGGKAKVHSADWNPAPIASFEQVLSSAFDRFPGICLGELHDQPYSKQFLVHHMHHLKECGVTTLFMEHLTYDTIQQFLDEYHASADPEQMPPVLKAYLDYLDRGFHIRHIKGGTFIDVVRAAKAAGIRIVAMDTSLSYDAGHSSIYDPEWKKTTKTYERMLGMNYVANKIIRHECGKGKYVALMGAAHGSILSYNVVTDDSLIQSPKTAPGVAELLGVPFIVFSKTDAEKNSVEVDVRDYELISRNHRDKIHFINMMIRGYTPGEPLHLHTKSPDHTSDRDAAFQELAGLTAIV